MAQHLVVGIIRGDCPYGRCASHLPPFRKVPDDGPTLALCCGGVRDDGTAIGQNRSFLKSSIHFNILLFLPELLQYSGA